MYGYTVKWENWKKGPARIWATGPVTIFSCWQFIFLKSALRQHQGLSSIYIVPPPCSSGLHLHGGECSPPCKCKLRAPLTWRHALHHHVKLFTWWGITLHHVNVSSEFHLHGVACSPPPCKCWLRAPFTGPCKCKLRAPFTLWGIVRTSKLEDLTCFGVSVLISESQPSPSLKGTCSVAATYKPPMLVPRARLPAGASSSCEEAISNAWTPIPKGVLCRKLHCGTIGFIGMFSLAFSGNMQKPA